MRQQIFELLTYFVIYSFAGWILESVFRSICEKKIINTGFLKGPFCPIYGIGAIIIYVFLQRFKDNIILLFFMGFIVLTIWEYIVGALLEKVFHTKYWDYSDHKCNFQGRVCLTNSIYWGILGIIFIKYINPFMQIQLYKMNTYFLHAIIYVAFVIVVIDATTTIAKVKNLQLALERIERLNSQMKEKLEGLKVLSTEKARKEIHRLDIKKTRILRKLYKNVYRLKKAFPTIESKEITEILNRRFEIVKKGKQIKRLNDK